MKDYRGLHSFAICAYQKSEFLEECILSLKKQTVPSSLYITTSTPNEWIDELAKKYDLPVYVNTEKNAKGSNICNDWNFAVSQCKTRYVTIAHQDDIYKAAYTEEIMHAFEECRHSLIAFSDYAELRNGLEVKDNQVLKIKRILLKPLTNPKNWNSIFWRRRSMSFGNPICCPAVSYDLHHLQQPIFTSTMLASLDWETWEKLSKMDGEFAFVNEVLMCHRIHEESTTTKVIGESHGRSSEDLEMFKRFWPDWIAKGLEHFYSAAEDANKTESSK